MQAVLYPVPAKNGGRNTYLFQCILQHFQSVQRIGKPTYGIHWIIAAVTVSGEFPALILPAIWLCSVCIFPSLQEPYRQKLSGFDIKTAAGINIAKTKFRQKTRGILAHISGKPGQRFFYLVAI